MFRYLLVARYSKSQGGEKGANKKRVSLVGGERIGWGE